MEYACVHIVQLAACQTLVATCQLVLQVHNLSHYMDGLMHMSNYHVISFIDIE